MRARQPTGWELGSLAEVATWRRPLESRFYFSPLCAICFDGLKQNVHLFSLSLLFGISELQISCHSLWHCQTASRWACSAAPHLPFPHYHSRIDCIHQPWRSRYKNQPTRFHLYPLGSNHHNLISFLIHPVHFPHTFICVQMLKYTYRPASTFSIHMFPTFSN